VVKPPLKKWGIPIIPRVSYTERCKFIFLWYTVNQTNRNLDLNGDLLNGNGIDKHHFHVLIVLRHRDCVQISKNIGIKKEFFTCKSTNPVLTTKCQKLQGWIYFLPLANVLLEKPSGPFQDSKFFISSRNSGLNELKLLKYPIQAKKCTRAVSCDICFR
jgi:hypothetical protein